MTIKINNNVAIKNSETIAKLMMEILQAEEKIDQAKEHFWTIGLNTQSMIQYIDLVSLGTLTNAVIHPRETFRLAVMKAVNTIIIVHNHPAGNTEPSKEDILITKRLKAAGGILGITLLDHVIIGGNSHYSFNAEGKL